ncbi:MAG: hypothetical protein AB1465_04410 [Patescibacteria group bacterium]
MKYIITIIKYLIPVLGLVVLVIPFFLNLATLQWVEGIIGALIILLVSLAGEKLGYTEGMKVVVSILGLVVLLVPFFLVEASLQWVAAAIGALIIILTVVLILTKAKKVAKTA